MRTHSELIKYVVHKAERRRELQDASCPVCERPLLKLYQEGWGLGVDAHVDECLGLAGYEWTTSIEHLVALFDDKMQYLLSKVRTSIEKWDKRNA